MFDRLWKRGPMTREAAYADLAQLLDLPPELAHIGLLDAQRLRRVIEHYGRMDPRLAHRRQRGKSNRRRRWERLNRWRRHDEDVEEGHG